MTASALSPSAAPSVATPSVATPSAEVAPAEAAAPSAAADMGMLSVMLMFVLVIAIAGAGLIVDGGRALTARRHAANTAEAAARSAVATQSLTDGFDPDVAAGIARSYALRSGVAAADIDVDVRYLPEPEVVVTITERRDTVFLILGGQEQMTVRAAGSATFVYSI